MLGSDKQRETVLGVSAFREQIGSDKEVPTMPRMPKYLKREWAFFLDILAQIHLFFIIY